MADKAPGGPRLYVSAPSDIDLPPTPRRAEATGG